MIHLPRILTDANFKKRVTRGSVLKTRFVFEDGTSKQKRIICLNKSLGSELYFVKATSQTHQLRIKTLKNNHVYINSDETPVFEVDTIIDLRKVFEEALDGFLERFRNRELEILGEITVPIMNRVDEAIRASKLIELRIKKLIL